MSVPMVKTCRAMLAALLTAAALPVLAEDLQMWERSGGNAGMVDALVAAWNAKNPDRKINLTYIPHTDMVPKIAQAIASGEVPESSAVKCLRSGLEGEVLHPAVHDRQARPIDRDAFPEGEVWGEDWLADANGPTAVPVILGARHGPQGLNESGKHAAILVS